MLAHVRRTTHKRTKCQYLEDRWDPVRFQRPIEDDFTCPGCGSTQRQGAVFYCDFCGVELGQCCHPHFAPTHRNHDTEISHGRLPDYVPPLSCDCEGIARCRCCNRLLCLKHCRKADISTLSLRTSELREGTGVVLCPNCKEILDPAPVPEQSDDQADGLDTFLDEGDLRRYLGNRW